ncbi:uncharacterized protein LOC110251926 [Exaiptasia diaphana]|uniref:Methyltransferase domain-containing protein n=1 Tax=Exaiptasia diaphana TaxID=2652724 RepID=A0A913YTP2_EXADI|nr:uncharacterized protein LOC110251926 [Exaiptasia diaphana]
MVLSSSSLQSLLAAVMSEHRVNEVDYHAHTTKEMRLLHEKRTPAMVLNKEFVIHKDVWHPNVCPDLVEYMCREVLRLVEEELAKRSASASYDFLEVGCGGGYTSVLVSLSSKKCRVWATDINEAAVANTNENAKLHGVENRVKAVVADVFNNDDIIGRKFDMIYWASAWAGQYTDKEAQLDPLLYSLIDPGYRGLQRFLSDAGSYLKDKGRLLVCFSYMVGSEELFKSIAHKNGWKLKILSSENVNLDISGIEKQETPVMIVELLKKEA